MKEFKKLTTWQKSYQLSLEIYRITDTFPSKEQYGLTSQMRRCAISIPSNIAEGSMRSTDKDYKNFLYIALGSAAELETQLLLAKDLKYIEEGLQQKISSELEVVMKMLSSFIQKLKANS